MSRNCLVNRRSHWGSVRLGVLDWSARHEAQLRRSLSKWAGSRDLASGTALRCSLGSFRMESRPRCRLIGGASENWGDLETWPAPFGYEASPRTFSDLTPFQCVARCDRSILAEAPGRAGGGDRRSLST